ncbi:hypothetical protein CH260_03010 [Rhodococcus sp. 05-2256-B2]|nr:hypothetical protein CH258_22540 [Rhodococcus sp. 05-2256-B4]OZD93889.1 hypothetical protein CH257_10420 [Rhodococcus sp. 05-2256-B3]OZE00988.1 hypothetical protein CH260_03010 [Rhodococcus sp. 05-2256-B2]OZE04591.1 hypothetical protein CH285_09170 [Rhodococcus sp. 05-2256-B1]
MSRPDTAAYAIEVRALSKSYGGKLVIDDLSFVVEPGTVTGFLGPNGSGKSTTMRLIVGLDRPSAEHTRWSSACLPSSNPTANRAQGEHSSRSESPSELENLTSGDASGHQVVEAVVDLVEFARHRRYRRSSGLVQCEHLTKICPGADDRAEYRDSADHRLEDRDREHAVRRHRHAHQTSSAA